MALGVAAFFPGGRPRFLPGVVAARVGVLGGRPRGLPELCGTSALGGRPRFFPADVAAAELGASIDFGGRPGPRFGVVAGVFATTGVLGGRPRFLGSVAPGVFAAAAARGLEWGGWDGVSLRLESDWNRWIFNNRIVDGYGGVTDVAPTFRGPSSFGLGDRGLGDGLGVLIVALARFAPRARDPHSRSLSDSGAGCLNTAPGRALGDGRGSLRAGHRSRLVGVTSGLLGGHGGSVSGFASEVSRLASSAPSVFV